MIASGPAFPDDLIAQSLATVIYAARESIVITSPYFVPSHNIAEALRIAAFRGVNITLILPKNNDSLMVRWASRTFFDDLLEAGVKIYHFEAGLLHTKSILIDNKLSLVGTVNMDLRSFLLNFEITIAVEDRNFANEVATLHENYLANSSALNMQNGSIDLSIIELSNGYFSCLVRYYNFITDTKRAYHVIRPLLFHLSINVFFTINTKATKTTAVVTNPAKPDSVKPTTM